MKTDELLRLFPSSQYQQLSEVLTRIASILLRIGLLVAGIYSLGQAIALFDTVGVMQRPVALIVVVVMQLMGFAAILLAVYRDVPSRADWLILLLMLLSLVASVMIRMTQVELQSIYSSTDVWLFSDLAGRLTLQGINPYDYDLISSALFHRSDPDIYSTPLLNGSVTGAYPYPALSFLVFIPFQLLGTSTEWIFVIFTLFVVLILFLGCPRVVRPLVLLPFFIEPRYLWYVVSGVNDIIWVVFILLLIVVWDTSRFWRIVWLGMAVAIKQQPWFLAPLLLIRLWHDTARLSPHERWYEIIYFVVGTGSIFLFINMPFILWDPAAWVTGLLEPLSAKMVPLGHGLSSLMLADWFALPKSTFSLIMYSIYGLFLIVYWRHHQQWRELLWVVPGIMLWFGHRSLNSYWFFFFLPLIFALMRSMIYPYKGVSFHPRWWTKNVTLSIIGITLSCVGVITAWQIASPAPIRAYLQYPIMVSSQMADEISLIAINKGEKSITPRFWVRQGAQQPLLWEVKQGPQQLLPDQTATFVIRSPRAALRYNIAWGAQIIVADANRYDWRTSVVISPEMSIYSYDAIKNGSWLYWSEESNTPLMWSQIGDNGKIVSTNHHQDFPTIGLQLNQANYRNLLMLDTWMPHPHMPVELWVNRPRYATHELNYLYGLEVVSTQNHARAWILFGDESRRGYVDGIPYYMIATPAERWSQQVIDVDRILTELDVATSAHYIYEYNGLAMQTRMMNLRLLFGARIPTDSSRMVEFGSIQLQQLTPDVDYLVDELIQNPAQSRHQRATIELKARNYDAAAMLFYENLSADWSDASAAYGLGRALMGQCEWDTAIDMLNLALDNNYAYPIQVYSALADAHWQLNNTEEATDYENIVSSLSENVDWTTTNPGSRSRQYLTCPPG